jgi:hypothetical protein
VAAGEYKIGNIPKKDKGGQGANAAVEEEAVEA